MIRKLSFRLLFLSSLVLLLALPFSNAIFAQGLELRIDSDNNGTIDNSSWERELAKSPFAFGKFIPYSETDEEFVEFQVVVPKAKNANEKRTLKFTFESNEVSLWEEMPNGKKVCLYKPDVSSALSDTKLVQSDSQSFHQIIKKTGKKNTKTATYSWNHFIKAFLEFIWSRNIDEVKPDKPEIEEKSAVFDTYIYPKPIPVQQTILVFYLKAETKPYSTDWENSKLFKRPTRTLKVDLTLNGKSIASDSARFLAVEQNSIYIAIHRQRLLSEAIVARSVYLTNTNVNKYGLQLLKFEDLNVTKEDFHIDNSGFFVQFYRDWIHDKYYVIFKGTDIRLSDIANDVLLCTGKPSPYLWNALKLGSILRKKLPVEIREKTVIVGHSLGGALASGACLTSNIRTDTFNALGISYLTLTNTLKLGNDSPEGHFCKDQIEKCFFLPNIKTLPNDRRFNSDSVPLYTFHTQYDILTILEEHLNAKQRTTDGTQLDILPTALGKELIVENISGNNYQCVNKDVVLLKALIGVLDDLIAQSLNNNQKLTLDILLLHQAKFIKNNPFRIAKLGLLVAHKGVSNISSEIQDQIELATRSHQMEAVIEEILILSGMPEAYGIRQ